LVIEGRRKIQNNDNIWEQGVSGVIRPQDVLPNNTVLSENVAELNITKREEGHVRDGYRRGWLGAFLDKYQAF
jgi:flagellar L-ring protein precursor FlgH